jgi:putative thioredoxin
VSDERAAQAASLRGAVDLSGLVNRPDPAAAGGAGSGAGAAGEASGAARLIVDVDDRTFTQLIEVSRSVPVIVDLWASWAEQSTQLSATLIKLAREYAGRFVLARVEVERSPQLAQAFQAQQVPTVAAVIGGRPIGLFVGDLPEAEARDAVEQVLAFAAQNGVTGTVPVDETDADAEAAEPEPAPLPPLHQEAYDAIERGDFQAAIDAYTKAIAQNPADADAKAGLAQVSLLHRLQGKTLDEVRAAAAAAPEDVSAQLDVADADLSGGHVEDAFDRLLTLFPKLDADGKNLVRERLVELFEVVGSSDARVVRARGRLASLLY